MAKILIVDDDQDIIKVLSKRLVQKGYEVAAATDGYLGVQMAHKEKPDLILLDLMLPVGGGLSVLKNMRMSAQTGSIPVIVLTGMKDDQYKQKIMAEGVDIFIEKPYDAEALIKNIEALIQNKG